MKGYYLWAPLETGCIGNGSGVEKKIRSQTKVLQSFFDTELIVLEPQEYKVTRKITSRLPLLPVDRAWKYQREFDAADFLYIRQVRHDRSFVKYLKDIKKSNPKVKIIYEIPTYPYEFEQKTTYRNMHYRVKDRVNRIHLKEYVDRIVTFYNQDSILGIPTIKLMNGFDFSTVTLRDEEHEKDTIHLIEVSTTAFWHGYDRLIEGLHQYYSLGGSRNVIFHMVGLILHDHEESVKRYNLQDHVVFHGVKSGKELQDVYACADAGIDVLGGHRKDYPVSSSLKSREYLANGIPIITSSRLDFAEPGCPYQLLVPYDDSPISVQNVIDYVDQCYLDESRIVTKKKIRAYGEEKCDLKQTMLPLIDYIRGK